MKKHKPVKELKRKDEQIELDKFKNLQDIYDDSKVVTLALSYISPESKTNLISESVKLLNFTLLLGNLKVQNSILNTMKLDPNGISFAFFSYFRDSLKKLAIESNRSKQKREHEVLNLVNFEKRVNSDRLLRRLLKLLQMVCENCNNDFQVNRFSPFWKFSKNGAGYFDQKFEFISKICA